VPTTREGIAITDFLKVGQTVQFHVRDEQSADEDLRSLLTHERGVRPDASVRGALLFSCNGRGSRLFSQPDHDVTLVRDAFGPIPVAGFFAMGEIGPIGGQNFLHGYTASVALFEAPAGRARARVRLQEVVDPNGARTARFHGLAPRANEKRPSGQLGRGGCRFVGTTGVTPAGAVLEVPRRRSRRSRFRATPGCPARGPGSSRRRTSRPRRR